MERGETSRKARRGDLRHGSGEAGERGRGARNGQRRRGQRASDPATGFLQLTDGGVHDGRGPRTGGRRRTRPDCRPDRRASHVDQRRLTLTSNERAIPRRPRSTRIQSGFTFVTFQTFETFVVNGLVLLHGDRKEY